MAWVRDLRLRVASGSPSLFDGEDYSLQLDAHGVELRAEGLRGAIHGLTTAAQLLAQPLVAPGPAAALAIEDAPAYEWRGLLVDVARHYLPLPLLLRTLDAMRMVKLNVLHLHLTDSQSFPLVLDDPPAGAACPLLPIPTPHTPFRC